MKKANFFSAAKMGLGPLFVLLMSMPSWAQTDISNSPVATGLSVQAKPNIMLLMKNSGTTGFTHMPDSVEPQTTGALPVGYKNTLCNLLYYNPAQTYFVPKAADGTPLPTPSITAAYYNYFVDNVTTVNLTTSFRAHDATTRRVLSSAVDPAQPAYYYTYTGVQTLTPGAGACMDVDSNATQAASGGGTFTRVLVSATSGRPGAVDERQNFAIWFSYYRTRMLLTKSAVSLAFVGLSNNYRVGFINTRPGSPVTSNNYLAINDFDTVQRTAWFNKVFAQTSAGASPVREALARVGRHYGGKQDGINTGMTGDPVQYSCQQNFTIMTTDGYWNSAAETAGPVQLDGTTLVGQQDSPITPTSGLAPRPIYDGSTDAAVILTGKNNAYNYAPCSAGYSLVSTNQNLKSTSQNLLSTSYDTVSTNQKLLSTTQNLRSTNQNLQSSVQNIQSTVQNQQSTVQNLQSTNQNLQTTTQTTQSTTQNTQSTQQNRQSTNQNLQSTAQNTQTSTQITQTTSRTTQSTQQNRQSTNQNLQSTVQNTQSTLQNRQSTNQNLQSTTQNLQSSNQPTQSTSQVTLSTAQIKQSQTQNLQSTTQTTQSTSQITRSTAQTLQSTVQNLQTQTQVSQSTLQWFRYDASTELSSPVAPPCITSGTFTCSSVATGPTLVASCTAASPTSGNAFIATTCSTTSVATNTPVASCTASGANSGNGFTTTTCSTNNTTSVPVASCTAASGSAGNNYTTTTCTPNNSGPTGVASCTPSAASSGNSYVATTCGTNNTLPIGVSSCTPISPTMANSYTTTTCATPTTGPTGVSSCTNASANSGNSWTSTTCSTNNASSVPVASCTPQIGGTGNAWLTITCVTTSTGPTGVSSCSPVAASSGNSYTATTCGSSSTGPTGVASCAAVAAGSGNSWTAITCGTNNSTNVPVASCTASGPSSGNSYTTTSCPAPIVTSNVPVASCTGAAASAGNSYTTTTCPAPITTSNVPVASCTASGPTSGNTYTTTTCSPLASGPTPVASCVASGATAINSYTATSCGTNNTTNVPVASCTPAIAGGGNLYTTTTCPAPIVTTNVPVASCTASAATAGNSYTSTTCPLPITTTNVPVLTCTASGANAGNSYTSTTCVGPNILTGPTPVASCTTVAPTAGNGFVATTCGSNVVGPTGVTTCTPQVASLGNAWTTITCNTNNTTNIPVVTCTPSGPIAGNGYTTTTCPPSNVTTNVAVASCTPSAANAGNTFTSTTCPLPLLSGPTPIASCTVAAASSGNSWVATTCGVNNTGPIGVATCTASAAAPGNAFTTTACNSVVTPNTPVASCTVTAATSGNSWTATTCPAPIVTTNVPVASCTAAVASGGNSWTTTTCPAPITSGPNPVASCTAVAASAGNSYTAATCPAPVVTTNVPVATCTAAAAASGNTWTTTTCPAPNVVTNAPVASCTPALANAGNSYTTVTCPAPVVTTNVPVTSCTPAIASSGNSWTTRTCPAANTTGPTPVATCTAIAASSGNSFTSTTCPAPVVTGPTAIASGSCSAASPVTGNNFVTTTCGVVNAGPTAVQTCTASSGASGNGWVTTSCGSNTTTAVPVASCTPTAATSGNSWVTTTCPPPNTTAPVTPILGCTASAANSGNSFVSTACVTVPGQKIQYATTTNVTTTQYSGGTQVSQSTAPPTTPPAADLSGVCYTPGINTLPSILGLTAPGTTDPVLGLLPPALPGGCSAWPCTTSGTTLTGSVNSLSDVAQYYYVTDLRPSMIDNVPSSNSGPEDDRAPWQHMTTFTIALGVTGTVNYNANYKSAAIGDFADIRTGVKDWPVWPDPTYDYVASPTLYQSARAIDDYWHAAVNGRGLYFSAGDPTSVVNGLLGALNGITAQLGAGAGASIANPVLTPTSNFSYAPSFTTVAWTGDVTAKTLDVTTALASSTPFWSAATKLNALVGNLCDNRNIYLMRNGAVNNLVNFSWNSYRCDAFGNPTGVANTGLNATEQALFGSTKLALLSQYASMTDGTAGTVNQRSLAVGAPLVNFLRGYRGNEQFATNDAAKFYRTRGSILGDIIDGAPAFVSAPSQFYADSGYASFKTANASRPPMLYVPANDGMLHALYAGTSTTDTQGGTEAWSVIPSSVVANMYNLADANYGSNHIYTVDGTPISGDVYDTVSSTWKTVLVGGLNSGGKGYYALDVTDPVNPKGLWEFKWGSACYSGTPTTSDCHLGLTYGRPLISKLADGTWVVMVTSGYNNINSPAILGDGQGYLYILNAMTGNILYKIGTGAGTALNPSGLAQITSFVDNPSINNTSLRVYGGDLLGNIWRFDVKNVSATPSSVLIGTTSDPSGVPQPISTAIFLAELNGTTQYLFVGTGKLLGTTDLGNTQIQSIYGIADPLLTTTAYTNLRASLTPNRISGTGTATTRTAACLGTVAQCKVTNGWVTDLPNPGERVNVDAQLQSGTLGFLSNLPSTAACSGGGTGYFTQLSAKTGLAVDSALPISVVYTNTLLVGLSTVLTTTNEIYGLITTGSPPSGPAPPPIPALNQKFIIEPLPPSGKRVSWREIIPAQ